MDKEQAAKYVIEFFEGDAQKAMLWFQTKNPMLGGVSPQEMMDAGREDKLIKFIEQAKESNEAAEAFALEHPEVIEHYEKLAEEQEDKKVNEKISDVLGVENDVEEQLPALVEDEAEKMLAILEGSETDLDADFEVARDKLLDLMNKGAGALENYLEVAEQSESPRAYEVLAKLIDTLSGLSKDTMELHKMKKNIEGMGDEKQSGTMKISDSNVIVATTSEVLDQIQQRKEE
jgi:hypothetical protein